MSFTSLNSTAQKKYDARFIAEAIGKYPAKIKRHFSVDYIYRFFYQLMFHCIEKFDTRFIAEAIEKYPAKKTFQCGLYIEMSFTSYVPLHREI